ncbi:Aste57867_21090 [Aphanomyces stellatus]|uniref:Aste57867_21090 protein n=1 Tax=Aphanomyces stellatus TaxID=120398 RepID=A0A485LIQ8_9STRA|nr:hypothetical protein As57867_021022 [Aphanomyces stellatus]VFT97764.1 Aste57867_21090 [Aphanomyces stellatus]
MPQVRAPTRAPDDSKIVSIPRPIDDNWELLNPHAAVRHTLPNWRLFGSINDESVAHVLRFLDGQSLLAAGQACKQLHALSNNDAMWLHVCRVEWGICKDELKHKRPVGGKQLYLFAISSMRTMAQRMIQEQCLLNLQRTLQHPAYGLHVSPQPTSFSFPA